MFKILTALTRVTVTIRIVRCTFIFTQVSQKVMACYRNPPLHADIVVIYFLKSAYVCGFNSLTVITE